MDGWQELLEAAVSASRFSGSRLARDLLPAFSSDEVTTEAVREAFDVLGDRTARYALMGMVRAIFLIELVNEAVTSTKFEVRWTRRLQSDPRFCSFDGCLEIFIDLLEALGQEATVRRDILERFARYHSLAYETPIDYYNRHQGHVSGNVVWIWDDPEIEETLLLRERVSDPEVVGELVPTFRLVGDKTRVKTYLTDRALTGAHKTNREKRWEAHPEGVQFAFRRDCLKIEHKLLSQVCHFEGFPAAVRQGLAGEKAIVDFDVPVRCPITRDPLDFELLRLSLESPEWGRSAFQVGHLNPLKGPGSGDEFGHTPANIAWITEDGNRIQGSLSYQETIDLLERIRRNYETEEP